MSASPDAVTGEALKQHASFVHNVAIALTGGGADADDLEQEAWLTLLRRRPGRVSELRPWFVTVLRKQFWGMSRGQRRRAEVVRKEDHVAENEPDPLERIEIQQRVVQTVMDLREPYRTTIVLRFYLDLSHREIAKREGIALSTVTTRLRRALSFMRARFEEEAVDGKPWRDSIAALIIPTETGGVPWGRLVLPMTIVGTLALGGVFVAGWGWPRFGGEGTASAEAARQPSEAGPMDHFVSAELELTGGDAWRERGGRRSQIDLDISIELEHFVVHGETLSVGRISVVAGTMIVDGQSMPLDCEHPSYNELDGASREDTSQGTIDCKSLLPAGVPEAGDTWSIEPADLVPFLSPEHAREDFYEVMEFEVVQGSFARGTDQWFDNETTGTVEAHCVRFEGGQLVVELQIHLEGKKNLLTLSAFEAFVAESRFEVSELSTRTTFVGTGSFTWDTRSEALISMELSGEVTVEEHLRAGFGEGEQAQRFFRETTLAGPLRASMAVSQTIQGEDK